MARRKLPRRLVIRSLGLAALILGLLASPAQASILGPESPHSPNAEDLSTAYWAMFAVITVLVVGLLGGLGVAVARFRIASPRPGGDDAQRRAPRTVAGRGAMARFTAPFVVLALAVFVFGIVMAVEARSVDETGQAATAAGPVQLAQVGVRGAPPAPIAGEEDGQAQQGDPLRINAVAQQWLWRFEYPGDQQQGQRTFSYGELVVPVDNTVILTVTSTDVVHRWWVPALGGQVDAIPGKLAETWFRPDAEGVYEGRSTAYSGTAYAAMGAKVRVVSRPEYDGYVQRLEQSLAEAQKAVEDAVAAGETP